LRGQFASGRKNDAAFSLVEEVAEYNTVKAGIRCTARKTVTNSSASEQTLEAVFV
tara:strand:- start:251366 stop:251530 length:165 start_codon:yes stop_codon:yes gene_type:complete